MTEHNDPKNLKQDVFNSSHHSFDIHVAAQYGIEEAIMIHHFQHWIGINQRRGKHHHEGRTWTYQSLEYIAAHFPYMTREQVRETIDKLCYGKNRKGSKAEAFEPVLMKGNFNKTKMDKTLWFAFVNEKIFTKGEIPKSCGEIPNSYGEIPTPIPDTKTTDTGNTYKKEESKVFAQTTPSPRATSTEIISFSFDSKQFVGISDKDLKDWKEIYPAVDINRELKEMVQWILCNDTKAKSKKLWRRFIFSWLQRSNEKSINKTAYQQSKKESATSRHTGLQKDFSPRPAHKTLDLSDWRP